MKINDMLARKEIVRKVMKILLNLYLEIYIIDFKFCNFRGFYK